MKRSFKSNAVAYALLIAVVILWVLPVRPGADGEKNEIPAGLTVLRWEAGNGKAVGRNG